MTNLHSDRVRHVRGLVARAGRRRAGRFLAEGPQAVREAVRCTPWLVRDVYLTPEAVERHPEIAEDASGLHVHLASPAVLDAMSADAQGVLAVVDLPADAVPAGRLTGPLAAAALPEVLAGRPRLVAVLARVRDPGNAGTVIRVADAAGADAVVIAGDSVEATNPKVVRSTAGSLFHLPVVSGVPVAEAVAAVRGAGLTVLAADGAGDLDLDDLQDAAARAGGAAPVDPAAAAAPDREPDLRAATAWLFGNEAWGLPAADRDLADAVVRVPLRGRAESLNLGTAAAVCLYASSRAHR
ncbi:RNA methyltransferase [Cellulomonas sp. C5510]|uniref:TrmH family RNA methyltransferase n=1 Tax=Cellulomonas sp. C5510 TaxID=2871170 RepID=UPI001C9655BC|nr:RNA methyltransferase [Cellulomonas sp. C5510]QZN87542.1 RNA methyltransferase [Cellulomonas sp. C5510]